VTTLPLEPASEGRDDAKTEKDDTGDRFEVLYERLQQVTARLEGGELTLDESLVLYDEGMRLAVRCQQLLAAAEQKIEVLRQAFDSGFDAAPGR
jgi:exodeoxyribonuclease VII small subunit